MEHIVQFAIGIDDAAIVKRVTESAENQIVSELKKKYESEIEHQIFKFERVGWGRSTEEVKGGLQDWVKDLVTDILHKHQEEIVEMAAEKLADKMSRTKAIKAVMVEKVAGEVESEEA